jgi:hypothetical protein
MRFASSYAGLEYRLARAGNSSSSSGFYSMHPMVSDQLATYSA